MNDREFFLARRKAELPAFLNVLKALPADQMDYKPHPNSPSAQQLAWTLATELRSRDRRCATRARRSFPTEPAPDLAGDDRDLREELRRPRGARRARWTRRRGRSRRALRPAARS